jgi:hypothetical protein
MARKVEAFPKAPDSSRYPWEEWLDGDVWELAQGEDFKGKSNAFRSNARSRAKKRGGKIRARILKEDGGVEKLYIQFYNE